VTLYALKLTIHSLLCIVLMWGCFCRLARSDADTRESVRMAFWLLFIVTFVAFNAPWAWRLWEVKRYIIQWTDLAVLAAFALVQVVKVHHWHAGAPLAFRTDKRATPEPSAPWGPRQPDDNP
jgi:hypothetical protein